MRGETEYHLARCFSLSLDSPIYSWFPSLPFVDNSQIGAPGWDHALELQSPISSSLLDISSFMTCRFPSSACPRCPACTFCSMPLSLNGPAISPVGQAINLSHPWLFAPLNFWLTLFYRIRFPLSTPSVFSQPSLWILSHTEGATFSLIRRFPVFLLPLPLLSIFSTTPDQSHLLQESFLTSTCEDLKNTQYFFHGVHHIACLALCLALCLMHNRYSVNICRTIVDTDWELCAKCLAK